MDMEPKITDFVDFPNEWLDEDDMREVNGHNFILREFTNPQRTMWLELKRKRNLTDIVNKFDALRKRLEEFNSGSLFETLERRRDKIDDEIQKLVDNTPIDKWDDAFDAQLDKLAAKKDEIATKLKEITEPKQQKLIEISGEIQQEIDELRTLQSDVFLEFTWQLSKVEHGETRTLEQYIEEATGSDRLAAQEVVTRGNFTWEAQTLTRKQRRSLKKEKKDKN